MPDTEKDESEDETAGLGKMGEKIYRSKTEVCNCTSASRNSAAL